MQEMLQNSEGLRSLPEKKCGNGVPPRSRPTTPLLTPHNELFDAGPN